MHPFLGEAGSLFTGVNYNLYQAPDGFCFDILCGDEPIIDNVKSRDYNVEQRVFVHVEIFDISVCWNLAYNSSIPCLYLFLDLKKRNWIKRLIFINEWLGIQVQDFLNYCQEQAKSYATNHIMMTMGGDFTYTEANLWYKNMDKLIK